MKRGLAAFSVLVLAVAFTFSVCGINIDGYGSYTEWKDAQQYELISEGEDSQCNITYANVKILTHQAESAIYILIRANTATISQDNTAVGAIIRINGGGDIRYTAGGTSFDSYKYYAEGAFDACAADSYMLEIKAGLLTVGSRLNEVSVQLLDENGAPSIIKSFDLTEVTSVTTTAATTEATTDKETTAKETTIKKTTVTKTTTSKKAATTKKVTTTKKATTKKATTQKTTVHKTAAASATKKVTATTLKTTVKMTAGKSVTTRSALNERTKAFTTATRTTRSTAGIARAGKNSAERSKKVSDTGAGEYTISSGATASATSATVENSEIILILGNEDGEKGADTSDTAISLSEAKERERIGNFISGVLVAAAIIAALLGYKIPKVDDSDKADGNVNPDEAKAKSAKSKSVGTKSAKQTSDTSKAVKATSEKSQFADSKSGTMKSADSKSGTTKFDDSKSDTTKTGTAKQHREASAKAKSESTKSANVTSAEARTKETKSTKLAEVETVTAKLSEGKEAKKVAVRQVKKGQKHQ